MTNLCQFSSKPSSIKKKTSLPSDLYWVLTVIAQNYAAGSCDGVGVGVGQEGLETTVWAHVPSCTHYAEPASEYWASLPGVGAGPNACRVWHRPGWSPQLIPGT